MVGSSDFSEVPVINIMNHNVKEIWPSLALAIKMSTFVALDLELSGLGNRKQLNEKSLPDRYKNIAEVAKTRSVLSMGLSCFKLQTVEQGVSSKNTVHSQNVIKQWTYSVQNFNLILLCSEDYLVEPGTLKFLVEHGFDFNKQYAKGVPYHRGGEKMMGTDKDKESGTRGPTARHLFDLLLWSEVPVVLHNGLVDLIFLYQNFYTDLPSTLQVFLADLEEMFPQGILDTKYAVEFVDRLPATYLEYAFRKWQRKNALQAVIERREVCLEFSPLPAKTEDISLCYCGLPSSCVENDFIPNSAVLKNLVCKCFASHGWCSQGTHCSKSHAIDLILDLDGIKAAKSRRRRHRLVQLQQEGQRMDAAECETTIVEIKDHNSLKNEGDNSHDMEADITETYLKASLLLEESRSGGHRAGFDAFMTGFMMACLLSKHCTADNVTRDRALGAGISLSCLKGVDGLINKVYAAGKDQPLTVAKSNFCSPSKKHTERIQKLRKL